ncbi:MAG: GAF domain-containing sensor histidine kinase [Caldilineaceae bacterium]|nr:GAF domain-containing sensor histidine kinase [Caldilineaceae bacterium]
MQNINVPIALRISLVYALLVSLWVFVAARLLDIFAPIPQPVTWLATHQDVLFVVVTALLVYTLVRRALWRRPMPALVNHPSTLTETASEMLPGSSVAHIQQESEINRRLAENNSIQRLTAALLQQQTLDDVLPLICHEAQELTGAGGARLLLLENEAWLRVSHQTGTLFPDLERVPIGHGLAKVALLPKNVVRTNDPTTFSQLFQPYPELKSLVAIPLLLKGKAIGTLHVVNKPGGFTEDDTRILSLFADQAALAIANARLHEQAKQLAVAKERQWLARELHDSVTQVLYSVILYADATRLALAADKKAEATDNLRELRTLARQAMADLRLLLFRLHPPELEEEGLVVALQARLEAIEARAGLQIDLRVEGENRLPIMIEDDLYKIAQEALNNVVKHAKAEVVSVHLRFTDDACWMTIQDDGVGFDPATAQRDGGLGLRNIAERVEQIAGELQLESVPRQGTKLQVTVKTSLTAAKPKVDDRLRPQSFSTQDLAETRARHN